jgi:hypothetical protein
MMLQNRQRNKRHIGIVSIEGIVVGAFAVTLLLGCLWVRERCKELGGESLRLEVELRECHRKCLYEESRWASMSSPGEIEKALRRHRLAMTWPSEKQTVRLDSSDVVEALRNGGSNMRAQLASYGRQR